MSDNLSDSVSKGPLFHSAWSSRIIVTNFELQTVAFINATHLHHTSIYKQILSIDKIKQNIRNYNFCG